MANSMSKDRALALGSNPKERRKALRATFEEGFFNHYVGEAFRSNARHTRFLLHAPSFQLSTLSIRKQLYAAHRRF